MQLRLSPNEIYQRLTVGKWLERRMAKTPTMGMLKTRNPIPITRHTAAPPGVADPPPQLPVFASSGSRRSP